MSSASPATRAGPFRPRTIALVLAVGAAAFVLLLYSIGQGWTGQRDRNGGEHAASTGLTGFAGLYQVLERTGHDASLSRSEAGFGDYGLLILTPPFTADGEEIARIIAERRYLGPTMLVLPKWFAVPIPDSAEVEKEEGWVFLANSLQPGWFADLEMVDPDRLRIGRTGGWEGYDLTGRLPDPDNIQALVDSGGSGLEPLVLDSEGDMLAGQWFPTQDDDAWPVVVVFEPDLLNNYGMADEGRARIADELIHTATFDQDLPVIFDLTLPGLGSSENLLTLAFRPPFLAATLCLMLAALVIAWRGFMRFGPAHAEAPSMARGKRQLALNGAALIGRVRRWHLLARPYANLVAARIAARLGIREHEQDAREQAIDRALLRDGLIGPEDRGLAGAAHDLREARKPGEILRAARALRTIERILAR